MEHTVFPASALQIALRGTSSATVHLSPAAMKVRDRFKDLVGFQRSIIHELGHAVVAAYLGHPLVSVTIEPIGDLAGACRYAIRKEDIGNNALTERVAVVTMAARVAVVMAIDAYELTEVELACTIDSHHGEYEYDDRLLDFLAPHLDVSIHTWGKRLVFPSGQPEISSPR